MRNIWLTTSILALATGVAYAQEAETGEQSAQQQTPQQPSDSQTVGQGEIRTLASWGYDPLYSEGRSVERILWDAAVVGESGEQIGDVENLVFDADGKVIALIARGGRLLGHR